MSRWLQLQGEEKTAKLGDGAYPRKIRLKLLQLLNDLVVNDDGIINDGFHVRDTLIKDLKLVSELLAIILDAKVEEAQET